MFDLSSPPPPLYEIGGFILTFGMFVLYFINKIDHFTIKFMIRRNSDGNE